MPGAAACRPEMIRYMPMAATVKPWSSLTKTRGSAHQVAALIRPRASADSEKASSGIASAISWKSKLIICCRPQENPYASAITRPWPTPSRSRAAWPMANGEHRRRDQQGLRYEQRRRRGEYAEERGQGG